MNIRNLLPAGCCLVTAALAQLPAADGEPSPSPIGSATPAATVPGVATGAAPIKHVVDGGQASGGPGEPQYSVTASWVIAGYNDNEVIYSIVIANEDPNVIRCTTLLNGYYIDNGSRHEVSDRQSVTLFPGKQSSAGTWVGLDQAAGATYKVTCRSVQ
jgi:hypothetical protein